MRRLWTIVAAVCVLCAAACAQPLAERVPGDAVVYIGWQGTEATNASYGNSRLKQFIDASDLRSIVDDFLPRLAQTMNAKNPQGADAVQLVAAMLKPACRYPAAFYLCNPRKANPGGAPSLGFIFQAGETAPALAQELTGILSRLAPHSPFKVAVAGDQVSFYSGAVGGSAPLASNDRFRAALAQVHEQPVFICYADIERMVGAAPQTLDDALSFQQIWQALGLQGVKQFIHTGVFDQKEWTTRTFIAIPAPRTGLPTMLEGRPIDDETLQRIPKSATMAWAGNFDAARLFTQVREAVARISPQAQQRFDGAVQMVTAMAGMDISRDILGSLGERWCAYVDPQTTGDSILGVVFVSKLRDPAKAEIGLARLEQILMATVLRKAEMAPRFAQTRSGELTIHYLGMMLVAPAWAIKDGYLYIGLYPQTVRSAVDAADSKGGSILDNPDFVAMRQRVGKSDITGFKFIDVVKAAPSQYGAWLFVTRYLGLADMIGAPSPAMPLPPLGRLMPLLAPVGGVSWMDEAGWHSRGVMPFPGASSLANDPGGGLMLVGQAGLATSVLLPSLSRARETANRVKCASNLRQIGQAILLYANENKGKYPPDLGSLLTTQPLSIEVFVCPSAASKIPPEVRIADKAQQAAWVNRNSDYVYIGKEMNTSVNPELLVIFEKRENHAGDGVNMLFAEGHVEFVLMAQAQELIHKQTGKTMDELMSRLD